MSERIVNHPKYGPGVVKTSRHKSFEVYVQFKDGITRWVRFDNLEWTPQPLEKHKPKIDSPSVDPHDPTFKSRRMIEAFRLGIVPYDCVEDFTFGRQEEIRQLMERLNGPENNNLLVGEYGTGKTHLLQYVYWHALNEGFAVARVEMDPIEIPFYKPKKVYSRLVQTFRYHSRQDDKIKGLRDFLKEVFAKGELKDHEFFKHLIGQDEEIFWEWIEGSEAIPRPLEWIWDNQGFDVNRYQYLPGLYEYSTAANIYCYLLSGLGWAAKEVLGYKGLLLIFDEAETLNMNSYTYQTQRSQNFLTALIRIANNDKTLLKVPGSGLDYCKVGTSVPFVYHQPSGLKLLLAFTPIYALSWINELESAFRVDLQSLTDESLKEVFENIRFLYNTAYGSHQDDLTIDYIFQQLITHGGITRLFVKGSVEGLDLARLCHGKSLDEVLQ